MEDVVVVDEDVEFVVAALARLVVVVVVVVVVEVEVVAVVQDGWSIYSTALATNSGFRRPMHGQVGDSDAHCSPRRVRFSLPPQSVPLPFHGPQG